MYLLIHWLNNTDFIWLQHHIYSMRLLQKKEKKGSAFHFQGEIWDEIQFAWYEAYFVEWLFDYCALVLPEYRGVFREEETYEGWWGHWLLRPNWHIAFYGLRGKFSLVLKNMLYILICTVLILFYIILSNFLIGFVDPKKVSNKKTSLWSGSDIFWVS